MELDHPIVFRFKIFPFLKDHILPKYMDSLRTEGNSLLTFTQEEKLVIDKYTHLLRCLYDTTVNVPAIVDLRVMYPLFEIMEKHMRIFFGCFNKVWLDEAEKNKILNQFNGESKRVINHILS